RRLLHERETHDELAAPPRAVAARLDRTAMHFDEPLHQREPDTEAALRVLWHACALHERLEDARQDIGRNAYAGVFHGDHDAAALAPDREPDPPAHVRVLRGIVQ